MLKVKVWVFFINSTIFFPWKSITMVENPTAELLFTAEAKRIQQLRTTSWWYGLFVRTWVWLNSSSLQVKITCLIKSLCMNNPNLILNNHVFQLCSRFKILFHSRTGFILSVCLIVKCNMKARRASSDPRSYIIGTIRSFSYTFSLESLDTIKWNTSKNNTF